MIDVTTTDIYNCCLRISFNKFRYFLVEKDVKYGKSRDVMIELAKIIYNSTRRIFNAYIVSDLIKQIDN